MNNNIVKMFHYQCISTGPERSKLIPCQNNCLETNNEHCEIIAPVMETYSCKFLSKKKGNHKTASIIIPCNPYTLENNLPTTRTTSNLQQQKEEHNILQNRPIIVIEDWDIKIIDDLVISEDYKTDLILALENNKKSKYFEDPPQYEFYTDGSLINRGLEEKETKMGAA